jgi:hypothetical protein
VVPGARLQPGEEGIDTAWVMRAWQSVAAMKVFTVVFLAIFEVFSVKDGFLSVLSDKESSTIQ